MLRISKLTDYGTLVMAYLASNMQTLHTAKDIAQHTHLTLPTVSKLLKLLAKSGLLQAHRGVKGGYSLAKPATEITLAQIISVLEGEMGLTECNHASSACTRETYCALKGNWQVISSVIYEAFNNISLAEMTKPIVHTKLRNNLVNLTASLTTTVTTPATSAL